MSLKKFQEILGQYPKVINPDEMYFPVSSIKKAFEEYMNTLKLDIRLSEEDLEGLKHKNTFDWCFDGVKVHIRGSEEPDFLTFDKLDDKAQTNAVIDYIDGWKNTHNEILDYNVAKQCCLDINDEVVYNELGEIQNER